MEMILDRRQFWAVFLFELTMGHKTAETTRSINNAFGPGTANEHTVQWWFKKFCKRGSSFEDEEHSRQPLKAGNDQLRGSQEKLPKNSVSTTLLLFGIWNKLERWKSSISGYLMSWLKVKKVILKCHLILCNNSEPFLNWIVRCDGKCIL